MKKILVMEDDEILNAGLCYNIQKKEMLPVSVYSIKDAKEKLKKETFLLVLPNILNNFDFRYDNRICLYFIYAKIGDLFGIPFSN